MKNNKITGKFNYLINFLEYQEKQEKLKDETHQLFKNLILFWKKTLNGISSFEIYHKETLRITKRIIHLKKNYSKMIIQYPDSISLLKFNSIFAFYILNNYNQAYFQENKIDKLKKNNFSHDELILNNFVISENRFGSIIVSYLQNWSKIIKYSNNCANMFGLLRKKINLIFKILLIFKGYSFSEFSTLNNVNQLMPEFIGNNHDSFIQNFFQSGKSSLFKNFKLIFARDKNGFIFPVKFYLNLFNKYFYDICFSGVIFKIKTDSFFIIIDNFGKIQGSSENFLNIIWKNL